MACIPGDNYESSHKGSVVDQGITEALTNTIDLVTVKADVLTNTGDIANNAADIVTVKATADAADILSQANEADLLLTKGRVTVNEADIAQNASDIAAITASPNASQIATNTGDIATNNGLIATNIVDIAAVEADAALNASDIATNASDIATAQSNIIGNTADISTNSINIGTLQTNVATNTGDIAANTANMSAVAGLYAPINGLNTNIFAVASPIAGDDAISLTYANATYLPVGGVAADSALFGSVLPSGYALNVAATDLAQGLVRKATSTEATVGLDTTSYMTPAQVKTVVDSAIATHNAVLSPPAHT